MDKEFAYYGHHACEALWRERPQDARRWYGLRKDKDRLEAWANDAIKHKVPVKWVEAQDLEKLTATLHHQGICIVALEKPAKDFYTWSESFMASDPSLLLFLDGVGNPHNLGAIVRTAAHFGVRFILGEKGNLPRLTPAANRTAEGGGECVEMVRLPKNSLRDLRRLKDLGYSIVVAGLGDTNKACSLQKFAFPKRSLLVMGSEQDGVNRELQSLADAEVTIDGTGEVESLNVSVSAAILMAEFSRQHGLND
jgi:TrmH RNA methyltransferase